jgi:hypothetical protein
MFDYGRYIIIFMKDEIAALSRLAMTPFPDFESKLFDPLDWMFFTSTVPWKSAKIGFFLFFI